MRRWDPGHEAGQVKTGKDYGLPAEYHDWVELSYPLGSGPQRPESGPFVEISWGVGDARPGPMGRSVSWSPTNRRILVPPKPKPTVPNVKAGSVVRYTDHDGDPVRVMRTAFGPQHWIDMHDNGYTDAALLADVSDDGFTVELGGLL